LRETQLERALVLVFLVPGTYGLKVDVSGGSGGSSSSFHHDFSLADDASVEGNILVSESHMSSKLKIAEPKDQGKFDYGKLNAEWWKWAFSMPIDKNPLYGYGDISEGQNGKVWFIGSQIVATETSPGHWEAKVVRQGEVPPGTRLFIPILNSEMSTIEDASLDTPEKRASAAYSCVNPEYIPEMYATIDGTTISKDELVQNYRALSDDFQYGPLPDNNVLQNLGVNAPAGTVSQSAADGFCLMTSPLTPGEHEIKWTATFNRPDINYVFTQDVTYKIKV
jgi:hypothetical protein